MSKNQNNKTNKNTKSKKYCWIPTIPASENVVLPKRNEILVPLRMFIDVNNYDPNSINQKSLYWNKLQELCTFKENQKFIIIYNFDLWFLLDLENSYDDILSYIESNNLQNKYINQDGEFVVRGLLVNILNPVFDNVTNENVSQEMFEIDTEYVYNGHFNIDLDGIDYVEISLEELRDSIVNATYLVSPKVINRSNKKTIDYQQNFSVLCNKFTKTISLFKDISTNLTNENGNIEIFEPVIENIEKIDFYEKYYVNNVGGANPLEELAKFYSDLNLSIQDKNFLLNFSILPSVQEQFDYFLLQLSYDAKKAKILKQADERAEKNVACSQLEYFLSERLRALQKEIKKNNIEIIDEDGDLNRLSKKIKEKKFPEEVKSIIDREYERYQKTPYSSPESLVIRSYLDWLLKMPWYSNDNVNKVDLTKVKEILDKKHYGLDDVKDQILEFMTVQNRRGNFSGNILCLVGAPGIGKTSLVKSIAEAMGRDYIRICLGGVKDESEIRGHRRTYIGALPGKFIQEMSKLQSNNPVILLDEIDKISSDTRGDPASALLEVLDPEQNKYFKDHYLDTPYDLSNVMFVATANSVHMSKPLLDRMDVINLTGYVDSEKQKIASNYIIPQLLEENCMNNNEIIFSEDVIDEIIHKYTHESGVRNLKRIIDKIIRKFAVEIDVKKIKTPIHVKIDDLIEKLGPETHLITKTNHKDQVGVINGLAYTELGGDLLKIEACKYISSKHEMKLTGTLGDVMKESCQIALSLCRSILSKDDMNKQILEDIEKSTIHIHFPDGATPKDGPSAGVAITCLLMSILTGRKIKSNIALTGEISLRGDVLPIGGLKEKLQGAINGEVFEVIIPTQNKSDIHKIPDSIKGRLKLNYIDSIEQVFDLIFAN